MKNYFTEDPGVIPKTVRLAFHHCMGGCNGCIAFDAVLNRGLVWYIQEQGANSMRRKLWHLNLRLTWFHVQIAHFQQIPRVKTKS